MIAIDLRKQQALDTDSKAIQQINFTRNLDVNVTVDECRRECRCKSLSLLKKQKKQFWISHNELWKYCEFILL